MDRHYLDFAETEISKIFDNSDFGYQKITVERPLRLRTRFTREKVESLRFIDAIHYEMEWVYDRFGSDVYRDLKPHKKVIEKWLEASEIKITLKNRNALLDVTKWQKHKEIMEAAAVLAEHFGDTEYDDFNIFSRELKAALKKLGLHLSAPDKKQIINCMSYRSEDAAPVIKKRDKDGTVHYEPDSELRDTESVPLLEDIDEYFTREVLPHVEDAWIDHSKTVIGYEISFTRYFYTYEPLRSLDEIARDILTLEAETDGILQQVVSFEG